MTTLLDDLRAIRQLLTPKGAWTQGDFARDRDDHSVLSGSPEAVCWCLLGAINRVTNGNSSNLGEREFELRVAFRKWLTGIAIDDWNDHPHRTHADVLELVDRAIAEAAHAE